MSQLTRIGEEEKTWYPWPISGLESILIKVLNTNNNYEHVYALRKNIAYNLQYLQFQNQIIQDIKLSSVLYTQTIKSFVLVGCSIIESLLHFILIARGFHTTTEWQEKITFKGNQKNLDGETVMVDTVIYKKLEKEQLKHMSFDAMIKCAKSKSVFGSNEAIYLKLASLRSLRNKVHLQVINDPSDTDWNTFTSKDLSDISKVLYAIFTSSLFSLEKDEERYFNYLTRNFVA